MQAKVVVNVEGRKIVPHKSLDGSSVKYDMSFAVRCYDMMYRTVSTAAAPAKKAERHKRPFGA
jgi:hypothetical protein